MPVKTDPYGTAHKEPSPPLARVFKKPRNPDFSSDGLGGTTNLKQHGHFLEMIHCAELSESPSSLLAPSSWTAVSVSDGLSSSSTSASVESKSTATSTRTALGVFRSR
ncbi:hypothetical protein HDU81_002553, partial [Chytriomyces hyalinus]